MIEHGLIPQTVKEAGHKIIPTARFHVTFA